MASEARKKTGSESEVHLRDQPAEPPLKRRQDTALAEEQPFHPVDPGPQAQPVLDQMQKEMDRLKGELRAAQKRVSELESQVDEDSLLPVLNRRGFARELERTLAYIQRHGTEVSLVYIDLDDFKGINDTYGHDTGDAALMHVADILIANTRRSDVIARLGGDEFALILHRADEEAGGMKAKQLEAALAKSSLVHEGYEIPMSMTTGITQLRGGDESDKALKRADSLMYANKLARKRSD